MHTLWTSRTRSKIVALFVWFAVFAAYEWWTISHGLDQMAIIQRLMEFIQSSALGPVLFILFYAVQPLIFFPSWLLSVVAGYVYGPVWGFAYLLIAGVLAALVAYGTGYFFGDGLFAAEGDDGEQSRLRRYAGRLREHSFETILVMRLLFLPFDAVSMLAGFLHVSLHSFLAATVLGSIPGTLAFALFGSSIEGGFAGQRLTLDLRAFGFSLTIFAISFLIWWLIQRRRGVDVDG
jgi:uncharacterized membrane protein YdjX (TVP38/TMEM64 family)